MPISRKVTTTTSSSLGARRLSAFNKSRSARRSRMGSFRSQGSAAIGGARRPARGSSRAVVLSRNIRSNQFLPERIITNLTNTYDAYWPIGRMTAAAGNYFNILVNAMAPMTGISYPITAVPGAAYLSYANLLPGCTVGQTPIGYTSIASVYANYRVRKYILEITVVPQNASDTTRVVVVPLGSDEIPATGAGSVNLRVMESQPYALAKTFASGVTPPGGNVITAIGYPNRDLGRTMAEYMALPVTPAGSGPATGTASNYGVYLQQLNGANNSGVVTIQIKVMQEVEWYDFVEATS